MSGEAQSSTKTKARIDRCARCGEPRGSLGEVSTSTMGRVSVWRCMRCGTRSTCGSGDVRFVFTCGSCGLPFPSERLLSDDEQRCTACGTGGSSVELPAGVLAEATDIEVRSALRERWSFVTSPSLQAYLDRLTRQIGARIDESCPATSVVIIDDTALKTLALPTTLLVSVGTLGFVQDEAELAFVLGHELAHAASGDPAARLVRLGFRSTGARGAADCDAWAEAAMDLVRLGYGGRKERDADARALRAMLDLGYDPACVIRYLQRIQSMMERGDDAVAQLATAHPPPAERIRRIEKTLFGRIDQPAILKVNRARFRRLAGREVLATQMVRVELPECSEKRDRLRPAWKRKLRRWASIAAVIGGLALLLLALGWFVGR